MYNAPSEIRIYHTPVYALRYVFTALPLKIRIGLYNTQIYGLTMYSPLRLSICRDLGLDSNL
jgi:hypothetical protein